MSVSGTGRVADLSWFDSRRWSSEPVAGGNGGLAGGFVSVIKQAHAEPGSEYVGHNLRRCRRLRVRE